MSIQTLTRAVVAAAFMALALYAYDQHTKANAVSLAPGWTHQINDSTIAQGAATKVNEKGLAALTDAAKTMKGKVVAGATITTKSDTAERPLQEVIQSPVKSTDSTRTAVLEDTTKLGITVRIEAEAPPAPAPLKIGYRVITPSFNPTIGFVRVGDSYAATVTWAGQQFTVDNAVYVPQVHEPRWALKAGSYIDAVPVLQTPQVWVGIEHHWNDANSIMLSEHVGADNRPALRVGYERTIWAK